MYCDKITSITAAISDDSLVVVYVHGWKHDASPAGDEVRSFRTLLNELVVSLATHPSWQRRSRLQPGSARLAYKLSEANAPTPKSGLL